MANYLDPYASELQGIQRQQEMAKMLLQQGQQQPQEQMVSGRVAPINPLAAFLPALNTYQGMNLQKNAESEQKKLADLVRGETNTKNEAIINAMLGKDYQPAIAPEIQRDDMGNVMLNVQEQSGQKPDMRQALALALKSGTPLGESLTPTILGQLTKQPETVKLGQGETLGQLVNGVYKPLYSAPAKEEPKTEMRRNYLTAKEEGYPGSFMDYERYVSGLRHPNINIGVGAPQGGAGGFDKKGNWITANGVPINHSEIIKDREIVKTANDLREGLADISPKDVQKQATFLGNVTEGGPKGYIAKQLGLDALKAQVKINASAVQQTLQNLPPGPASDKDIMQAKSTFPGYGDAGALQDWIDNTNKMLDRKIRNTNEKYGSPNWYGAVGIESKPLAPRGGATGDFGGNGFTIREKK